MRRGWKTHAVRGEVKRSAPPSTMRVPSVWRAVPEEANRAVAVFGFDPTKMDASDGGAHMLLPLFVGDVVTLLQECEDGWYLGHSVNNPGHKGVFPRDATKSSACFHKVLALFPEFCSTTD